ncbi:TDP-N-acetylfucosamine:lipid II N-acetylfucosaminyltransferase [Chitinophaga flava]|uniref:4-alpha-L-fucosyltransferase n=1 Tax=Chitinophaga flava TaxID=2259036 RepID=A0A365XXC6_9BACT|nr:TDP-N-acetylfucosamine:lipid II N-acetylfucosaminyltransferase [Chitinophaga flava]RBL90661.1 hypothetical protein DF182_29875 [Chitinophaga flava]
MNYHLMIDDKFINDFIIDAEKAAPGNNTYIIDQQPEQVVHVKSPLARFAPYDSPAFKELVKGIGTNDKIFIHWLSEAAVAFVLSLSEAVPVGVCFWGGDIVEIPFSRFKRAIYGPKTLKYFEREEERTKVEWNFFKPKQLFKTFKSRYIKYPKSQRYIAAQRDRFFRRLNFFLNWNEIDHQWIHQHYTTNVALKYFFYNVNPQPDNNGVAYTKKEPGVTTILLGNSATSTNNHLEAMEALAKFKDEPIRLVIPLNYGSRQYGDFVEQKAVAMFGREKVNALRDFMNRDDYYRLLDEVDIAFMPHYRSQAVGNTLAMLYRGKKLFLHHKSSVYQLFKRYDVNVYDVANIPNMTFDAFKTATTPEETAKDIARMETIFDTGKKMQVLKEMLS